MCGVRMRRFSGRPGRSVGVESGQQRRISSVRRFRVEDADAVRAISDESPRAANWSRESYVKLAEDKGALALVIEMDGDLSGFLVGRLVADQAELLNLAVSETHRRKGEGSALLRAALVEFRSRGGKSVYLEVRESNTGAIAFYEKHGFGKTGCRRGYYRDPDEAAVIMGRKLTG